MKDSCFLLPFGKRCQESVVLTLIFVLFTYLGGRIWWKGKAKARHIGSGLNPFILYTRATPDSNGNNVGMIDSAGKIQELTGVVDQISVAPDGLWVANPHFGLYFLGMFPYVIRMLLHVFEN